MLEKARVAREKREHERAEREALEERQRVKQLHFMAALERLKPDCDVVSGSDYKRRGHGRFRPNSSYPRSPRS